MSTASLTRYDRAKADLLEAVQPNLIKPARPRADLRALADSAQARLRDPRPAQRMTLVDCRDHGQRPPVGAIYIGRAMPNLQGSALSNPFGSKSNRAPSVIAVEDDAVLEHYKRWLITRVVEGAAFCGSQNALVALRELKPASVLACWCASREAAKIGANRGNEGGEPIEQACHGDVIWTLWDCLEARQWAIPWTCHGQSTLLGNEGNTSNPLTGTPGSRTRLFDETKECLYELAFGGRMLWGVGRHG